MLRILGIVYLFSLANGLLLLAMESMLPPSRESAGGPAEAPEQELVPDDGIFARYSVLLVAAGVVLAGMLERWRELP